MGFGLFLVLALDTEGEDANYVQVGLVGEAVLEAAVFGPDFFPDEIKEFLCNPAVLVIGRSVHEDLTKILGRATGFEGSMLLS